MPFFGDVDGDGDGSDRRSRLFDTQPIERRSDGPTDHLESSKAKVTRADRDFVKRDKETAQTAAHSTRKRGRLSRSHLVLIFSLRNFTRTQLDTAEL